MNTLPVDGFTFTTGTYLPEVGFCTLTFSGLYGSEIEALCVREPFLRPRVFLADPDGSFVRAEVVKVTTLRCVLRLLPGGNELRLSRTTDAKPYSNGDWRFNP